MSETKALNPGQFKPGNTIGGRWKPGQSGNPGGRPKSKPFKEALERQLALLAQAKGVPDDQGADVLMAALLARGVGGDVAAIKECMDRLDGKVPNPIGGTDELPPITAFSWKPQDQIESITSATTDA